MFFDVNGKVSVRFDELSVKRNPASLCKVRIEHFHIFFHDFDMQDIVDSLLVKNFEKLLIDLSVFVFWRATKTVLVSKRRNFPTNNVGVDFAVRCVMLNVAVVDELDCAFFREQFDDFSTIKDC